MCRGFIKETTSDKKQETSDSDLFHPNYAMNPLLWGLFDMSIKLLNNYVKSHIKWGHGEGNIKEQWGVDREWKGK